MRKTEGYISIPLTCMKLQKQFRYVQVRTQVVFCPKCGAQIRATEDNHPKFCANCGEALNWKGFSWLADEVLKLLPPMTGDIE